MLSANCGAPCRVRCLLVECIASRHAPQNCWVGYGCRKIELVASRSVHSCIHVTSAATLIQNGIKHFSPCKTLHSFSKKLSVQVQAPDLHGRNSTLPCVLQAPKVIIEA